MESASQERQEGSVTQLPEEPWERRRVRGRNSKALILAAA